jgi:SOS-response transcriptional repressor LexA
MNPCLPMARPRPRSQHEPEQLFRFIVDFKSEHDGNSPTIREIMQACGITSTSVCSYNLKLLARSGRIRLCRDGVRASRIEVVGGHWSHEVST